jgi:hypothetical protein
MSKKRKEVGLDQDTIDRLEILAALNGLRLKPYMEMTLKRKSYESNDLIGNWQNQSPVTDKTFKK